MLWKRSSAILDKTKAPQVEGRALPPGVLLPRLRHRHLPGHLGIDLQQRGMHPSERAAAALSVVPRAILCPSPELDRLAGLDLTKHCRLHIRPRAPVAAIDHLRGECLAH